MNLNNDPAQDYSNLQTENSFVPLQIPNNNNELNNVQHTSINNVGMSNPTLHIHQNTTFEFYLPLPNDTRVYHVTYTELNSFDIARRLNNNINLSHIADYHLPHHHNIQSLIQQLIHQQVQQQVQQPVESQIYQPNSTQHQSFDTMRTSHDNNIYNAASSEPISDNRDTIMQTTPIQK